jgi:tetratricopeptide (TPR) repeat protein
MKKIQHLLLMLLAIGATGTMFWISVGDRIGDGGLLKPALLGGGLLLGNTVLLRFAASERFRSLAWFVTKAVMFDAGLLLVFGLLFAVQSVPPADKAPTTASEAVVQRLLEIERRLATSGDQAGAAQMREERRLIEARLASPGAGLPAIWRWALMLLGGVLALAGLFLRDEWLAGPFLKVLPATKGRKRRAEASAGFQTALKMLRDEKIPEALPFFETLDTDLLSPALRHEGEFYKAYAAVHAGDPARILERLAKLHRGDPEDQACAYLLAYAYLSAKKPADAQPIFAKLYERSPDFLDTKEYYSSAALAEAEEHRKKGDIAAALPLFEVVRKLDVHAGSVPQSMENEKLMAAASRLRQGQVKESEADFAKVAREGEQSSNLTAAALARTGQAIAWIQLNRTDEALQAFPGILNDISTIAGITLPADSPEEALYRAFDEDQLAASQVPAGRSKNAASDQRMRAVLRDVSLLQAYAHLTTWSRVATAPDLEKRKLVEATLRPLRRALELDLYFADALGLFGMILHFRGRPPGSALSYLEAARRAGFEEPFLVSLLQQQQNQSNVRARTKTELMDHLGDYLINPEVSKLLKEQLLREETIRTGYQQYAGGVSLDEIAEVEPSLQRLAERTSRLAEDLNGLVKEWETSGAPPAKITALKQALDAVVQRKEKWMEDRKNLEESEVKLLCESGLFALSDEF